jgi:transposase-like protein
MAGKRRVGKRRRYTDEDKANIAVAVNLSGGNIRATARMLGIPSQTINSWMSGRSLRGEVAKKYEALQGELSAKLEGTAHRIVDGMSEKIDQSSLKDLATSLAITIEQMRLLREQPTQIIESTDGRREMLERLIERTMQEFPAMSREEVIEAIRDVRPEAIKLLS